LLVAGCGGPAPKVLEPKAAPTATITVPVPKMPASAKADTPSGAANFVSYFVATLNYGAQTGDTGPLIAIVSPSCKSCREYAVDFERFKANHTLHHKPVWTLIDVAVGPSRDPIEVEGTLKALNAGADSAALTFRLNEKAPFELREIAYQEKN